MTTKTKPPKAAAPKPASRRPHLGGLVREVVGALIVAVGVVIGVRTVFGVSNGLATLALGYGAFVATIVIVEMTGSRRTPTSRIDLTAELVDDAEPVPLLQVAPTPDVRDEPIRPRVVSTADVAEVGIAAVSAAAFAELVRVVLHMRSIVGFTMWWYVAFIVIFFVLARDRHDPETALDRVITIVVWSIGLLVAGALFWMLSFIAIKGYHQLKATFFTQDLSKTGPLTPGGGAKHAIIGTLEQVGIATILVVPIGILTAVYLHEINGRLARPVRFIVDAMSGLPSIIAGLFIFTLWVGQHGFSGIAGSAALVVLMLPTMTRATEEILRTVPDTLREGALALGAPQWRLVQRVVIPTALAGIMTAALLAVARAIGETAPVLLTALGTTNTNTNPFHGTQSDLPLFVWSLYHEPNQTQIDRALSGALVLVLLVGVLFTTARIVANRGTKKLGGTR